MFLKFLYHALINLITDMKQQKLKLKKCTALNAIKLENCES